MKKYSDKINSPAVSPDKIENKQPDDQAKGLEPKIESPKPKKISHKIKTPIPKRTIQSVAVPQKKPQTESLKLIPQPRESNPNPSLPTTPSSTKTQNTMPDEKNEERYGLLGSWYGAKKTLKDNGIDANIAYKGDSVTSLRGVANNKSVFLGNLDVTLNFDLEKIIGTKGLSLFVYGLGNHGDHPTEFIGDSFGTSNIEAPNTFKAYEFYLRQAVDERFSVLLGLRV